VNETLYSDELYEEKRHSGRPKDGESDGHPRRHRGGGRRHRLHENGEEVTEEEEHDRRQRDYELNRPRMDDALELYEDDIEEERHRRHRSPHREHRGHGHDRKHQPGGHCPQSRHQRGECHDRKRKPHDCHRQDRHRVHSTEGHDKNRRPQHRDCDHQYRDSEYNDYEHNPSQEHGQPSWLNQQLIAEDGVGDANEVAILTFDEGSDGDEEEELLLRHGRRRMLHLKKLFENESGDDQDEGNSDWEARDDDNWEGEEGDDFEDGFEAPSSNHGRRRRHSHRRRRHGWPGRDERDLDDSDFNLETTTTPRSRWRVELDTLLKDRTINVQINRSLGLTSMTANARAQVSVQDGVARDGVVHVIESVLVPPRQRRHSQEDDEKDEYEGDGISVEELVERLKRFVEKSDEEVGQGSWLRDAQRGDL
jgi:hypothetical protein